MMDIGIIGTGKVGATLARLWAEHGFNIKAVYSRNRIHAEALAAHISTHIVDSPVDVVRRCDLTLLTVSDDAIRNVAETVAETGLQGDGKAVIHVSGAHDATALDTLAPKGFMIGSLHPAFPFADVETTLRTLPGTTFAIEATGTVLRGWLHELVTSINGRVIDLPPGSKAIYHAALVMTSNYTVTLYALSERLLTELGAERDVVNAALDALLAATVENIRSQRIPAALTGPLARADTGTLKTHINALKQVDPALIDLYIQLARQTYPLLEARGVDVERVEHLLQQEKSHAADDS